jgi:hypothetical protein
VVGAVSARVPVSQRLPLKQLRAAGYRDVPVRPYSREEAKTVLDLYHATGVLDERAPPLSDATRGALGLTLFRAGVGGEALDKLMMVTGGAGRRLLYHAMCI